MKKLLSVIGGLSAKEPAADEEERRSGAAPAQVSASGNAKTPAETAALGAAGAAASDDSSTDSDDSGTDSDGSGTDSGDDGTVEMRLLLMLGADPTKRDGNGDTPLHLAAAGGKIGMVEALLEAVHNTAPEGVDGERWAKMAADARGHDLRTPLHLAAEGGHVLAVGMLLAAGASVDAPDANKRTPLHLSAAQGHCEVANILVGEGATVDALDKDANTPLDAAAFSGHAPMVRLLLEKGADPFRTDSEEGSSIVHAVRGGNRETVQVLLDKVSGVNAKVCFGATALHYAAGFDQVDLIEMLLEKGADIEALTNEGNTPLWMAVAASSPKAVEKLLAKGASVQEQALIQRVAAGSTGEAKKLLLVAAAKSGCVRAIKALVVAGVSSREPVLRLAIENAANAEIVWALADVDPDNFRQAAEDALLPLATAGNVTALKAVIATGVEFSERAFQDLARAIEDKSVDCLPALLQSMLLNRDAE